MNKLKEKQILELHNSASEETKKVLENLYGKAMFDYRSIIERVKTFEDACAILGESHLFVQQYRFNYSAESGWNDDVGRDFSAYLKLRIIIAALNEGWDVRKQIDGYYWRVVFRGGSYAYASDSLACANADFDTSFTYSVVSSRLVFKSGGLADYCAKQFADLWRDFFIG